MKHPDFLLVCLLALGLVAFLAACAARPSIREGDLWIIARDQLPQKEQP